MGSKLTRREFFRRSSAAGALVSAEVVTAKGSTHPPGWAGTQRTQEIATNCEMCFWRCGVLAEVADGKVVKLSGIPPIPSLAADCAQKDVPAPRCSTTLTG